MNDMATKQLTSFLGRGWAFPPRFDRDRAGVSMVSDEDDIRQSLVILLGTAVGERILEPTYGCQLHRFVFEPVDTTLRTQIEEYVRDAILYHEPRVVLERVQVTGDQNEGRLDITVDYRIPTINRRSNLVYPFYLEEASEGRP